MSAAGVRRALSPGGFRLIYGLMPEHIASRSVSRPLLVAAGAVVLALAGSTLLWAHYGATVFFETIRAGFVACFG